MDDTVQNYVTCHSAEEGHGGRIDVLTGPTGRRRWPEHVKAELVLESYRDGVSVADVARKHGISAPQLHSWRRAAREGVLAMPDDDILGLAPVVVEEHADESGLATAKEGDAIILEVKGVRVLVPARFAPDHLGRVLSAIRAST
jgi:transposase